MARQTTDHYEEEIGVPNRFVYRHIDSESSFTEPGADTPGPPHQPSAFVPVTYQHHSENTNSMVVVVPIARQSNLESSSQEREQRRDAFGNVSHGNRHRDTPLSELNDERRLMPPPQPVDPRPGELPSGADFGRASTMTASTIGSIEREIRSPTEPIPNIPMTPRSPIVPVTSIGLTEPHTGEVRYAPPSQPPRSVRRQFGDPGLSDSTQHHRAPISHPRVEEYQTDREPEFRLPRPNPSPRSSYPTNTGELMEVDRQPIRRPAQVLQPTRPRADHRQVEPVRVFNPTPSIHQPTTPATSLPTPAASASLHASGTLPLTRPIHSNPAYSHNPQASTLQYSPNQTGSRAPTLSSNLPSTPQQNQAALAQPSHIQPSRETNDQLATPTVLPANTRPRRQEPLYQESNLSQVQPPPMPRPVQQPLQMTANSNAQQSSQMNNNSYQTQSGHASTVHLSSQPVNVPGPTTYVEPAHQQFIPSAASFLPTNQTHGPLLAASTTTIPSRNVQLSGSLNYQPRITQPAVSSQIIRSGPVVQPPSALHAHNQHHNQNYQTGHLSPMDFEEAPYGHSSRIPSRDHHQRRPHHASQHHRPISPYRRNNDDHHYRSLSPHESYPSRNSRRALDFSRHHHGDRRADCRRDHSPYDRDDRDYYSPRQSRSPFRRDRRDRDDDRGRRRIDSYDDDSPHRSSSREARHQSNPRDRRKSDPNSTRMETNSMNQLVPQTNNPGHLDDPRLNPRAHLSAQENQTNNQLIQLSSISNTIGLGNLQNSLNAMIVPMIKDQGIQQGHREMAQNYQMQMELKELRSQQAQDASRDQQLKETMVEMLENKFKELTKSLPEKIREASGERERRSSERWPDLVKTPESNSASSQYSDVEQSPYRKPRYRTHHPYRRPHRSGEYDSPQGSPAESISNRRLHRNISGNSGGFSSAQSSPVDSVMDDSNFQANSLSPTQYSDLTTEEVCSKLQEWHMSDEIIENFRREKINGRHLNYLNEYMIRTGLMTQEAENENLRQIRPLAERLGPRKTLWRALRMHVTQKSLPLSPSLQSSKDCWRNKEWITPMGDVGLWLRTIQLGEFTRNFADEQVEGTAVYDINELDLIHLGLEKLGDRLTFVIERDMMT